MTTTFNEKVSRALWMSALGDAIGDPFEFDISITNGDVENFINSNEQINFTDDTQMTLFGFEETLSKGKLVEITDIQFGYIDWYQTQMKGSEYSDAYVRPHLMAEEMMYRRCAPGLTCLSALASLYNMEDVENNSKGCGSVMRLLPFVHLIPKIGYENAEELAIQSGLLTHKHEENIEAIRFYMEFVAYVVDGVIPSVIRKYSELLKYTSISQIGTGWTAMECVKMAIWAVLTSNSLEDCMIKAIAHDGDSDSVAAVACGIYGLTDKVTQEDLALVSRLGSRLEERHIIERFAQQIRG